ncbi:MAG: hypothetical protein Q9191_005428 [Dirinaria sp. TL-2023a]
MVYKICVLSVLLSFFSIVSGASVQANACQELEAKFPSVTFFATDSSFANETVVPWSETCQVVPACIFEPISAQQIANGLAILRKYQHPFALRSGGHMPVPGANGLANEVLVSTERLTSLRYSQGKSVVQIGAGLRWSPVYDFLANDNLAVAGGRFGAVGVSGLLLGGGFSYFSSEYGWGASSIINYEIVLANGTIVNANSQTNSDIWWALKGGSSNFGIVTRFDMKTWSLKQMWGGSALYSASALNDIVEAYASYTVAQGGSSDPYAHSDPSILINATSGEVSIYSIYMHKGPDPNPASLSNFTKIPATFSDLRLSNTINGLHNDTNPANFRVGNLRQLFSSTATKSSAEAVRLINTTLFDCVAASPQLKSVRGLQVTNTYQTFTSAMIKAAQAAGGDAIGLHNPNDSGINSVLYGANWEDAKDDATVNKFIEYAVDTLDQRAKTRGLYYDSVWINDAAPFQTKNVFPKYGDGANYPKLKAIAKKYDPDGVFQHLLPGGFKL